MSTQREKLMKAVYLAKEPGGCRYVINGEPGCVIAQLATLEGVSLDALCTWDTMGKDPSDSANFYTLLGKEAPEIELLTAEYSENFLARLQSIWDASDEWTAADDRERMRCLVNKHYPKATTV